MFNLFKRKPKLSAGDTRPIAPVEFDDRTIMSAISDAFNSQPDTVGALFLVAHMNLQTYFHFFKKAVAVDGGYPPTMSGFSGFLAAEGKKRTSSSLEDEGSRRRYFYFYIASLLNVAIERATVRPTLWDDIADIWLALIPGARAIRRTLDKTSLWTADEAAYFDDIKTEKEGERYWLGFLAPQEIRYHKKVFAWHEKDLSPETLASIREAEKLMRGD
jgi:hypothetical protein